MQFVQYAAVRDLYFGHWLLNRAKLTTSDIKNVMNPL